MLRNRILTALVLAPLVVAGVWWLPSFAFLVFFEVVALAALWEWQRLIGLDHGGAFAVGYFALAALAMVALSVWAYPRSGAWLAWMGVAWWCLAAAWLMRPEFAAGHGVKARIGKAAAGLLAVLPAWALLGILHAGPRGGAWVLFLFALVWAADIAAYFVGKRYGRAKLAPRISPKKTRAGAYGALAGGSIVALIGGYCLGMRGAHLIALWVLVMITVVFSMIGDLFESLIKRQSGVKDSSKLLPGHGGILDRLDSLFAAVPVFTLGHSWLVAP